MDDGKEKGTNLVERWDALDRQGRLLGFDLIRGRDIPAGIFHAIAEIYTVTSKKEILVTRRGKKTLWPFCWEVTTGAVVRGETPEMGAVRELEEETGLKLKQESMVPVYRILHRNEIYFGYLIFTGRDGPPVRLQAGETSAYRYLPYLEFKQLVRSDQFAAPLAERFLAHEATFDRMILGPHWGKIRKD